jgi:hypothetical protein
MEVVTLTVADLPDAAVARVLSFLPLADLRAAEAVCRQWARVAMESRAWLALAAAHAEGISRLIHAGAHRGRRCVRVAGAAACVVSAERACACVHTRGGMHLRCSARARHGVRHARD